MLAFDTATPATTVAVHDGAHVLAESTTVDPRRHGELLAPAIAAVLVDSGLTRRDITQIAVGVGPGPFTGLRVGLVTAQTLGSALGVPVRGVCTLDLLAATAEVVGPFVVATDARRKEVYWARYADLHTRVDGPYVAKPADVATTEPVVGRGALLYPEAFPTSAGLPDASAVALADLIASGAATVVEPQPLYLRRPDAAVPGGRKRVLAG